MEKILFENEYFKSVKLNDLTTVVTVLKDENKFYGIDLKGCQLITTGEGFIADKYTQQAIDEVKAYCSKSDTTTSEQDLWTELRCRSLNCLMGMI